MQLKCELVKTKKLGNVRCLTSVEVEKRWEFDLLILPLLPTSVQENYELI